MEVEYRFSAGTGQRENADRKGRGVCSVSMSPEFLPFTMFAR